MSGENVNSHGPFILFPPLITRHVTSCGKNYELFYGTSIFNLLVWQTTWLMM